MKVKATATGFFNKLREPGEVFMYPFDETDEDAKLPSWMVEAASGEKIPEVEEVEEEDVDPLED